MGKRTYLGGNTVLNRWGGGWARDELAPGEPDPSEPDPPSNARQPSEERILSGREDYRTYQKLVRKAEMRARSRAKGRIFKPLPPHLRPKKKPRSGTSTATSDIPGIERACHRFRVSMNACHKELGNFFQAFPRGCCGDVASLLAAYLKDQGLGIFAYVSGMRESDGASHAWLEQDGLIMDATADQFSDGAGRPMVTSDGRWHHQFGEDRTCLPDGDFRLDNGPNGAMLISAYSTVQRHIERS